MKASAMGIYTVLSTAAQYITSTPLCYVNCCDKEYTAKYYILQATNWLTHGYGESPQQLYILPSGCALVWYIYNHLGYIPRNHGLTYTYISPLYSSYFKLKNILPSLATSGEGQQVRC